MIEEVKKEAKDELAEQVSSLRQDYDRVLVHEKEMFKKKIEGLEELHRGQDNIKKEVYDEEAQQAKRKYEQAEIARVEAEGRLKELEVEFDNTLKGQRNVERETANAAKA